jgi:non-lysosomal glucosylceramidase
MHTIPTAAWTRRIGQPLNEPAQAIAAVQPLIDDGFWQGLPLGGFGSGSVGRTYRGDFARWHFEPGFHHFESRLANQFAVRVERAGQTRATVLCPERPTDRLAGWSWNYPAGHGSYHALFPKAWFVYDPEVVGCDLTVKQFSPIIPGNYRESSYPVGVFEAVVHNPDVEPITVSLLLTWENLVGWERGTLQSTGQVNGAVTEVVCAERLAGVVLDGGARNEQFAIGVCQRSDSTATYRGRFVANSDGAEVWQDFVDDGQLDDVDDQRPAAPGEEIGAAVAIRFELAPGESKTVPFALAWDLPIMQFGAGRQWYRRYTAFYGASGRNAWAIVRDALLHYQEWEAAIDAWQSPILADARTPEWYKTALFNELYFLVDGGTAWENGEVGKPNTAHGRFAYLESYDYPFYSTLDVRFYSSWALLLLWPELEKQELRQFVATVELDDPTPITIESARTQSVRKRRGALPHDLGAPGHDPWIQPNSYLWQDVSIWKDLNSKFVLMVYRDYVVTGDRALLSASWPAVREALAYLKQFDRDGDGLPENDGVPDQTYDTWPMTGPSAYCGGLWLAALRAAEAMGTVLGDAEAVALYASWRTPAEQAYDRLWNGRYYNFDSSPAGHADSIMADQLCGQWYAQALDLPDIVPIERVRQVLKTVYASNVQGFASGQMGAVNGMRPDVTVDRSSDQSQEVWTGVSYALAAFMLQNGMVDEAFATARGIYEVTYRTKGLWFRTPEAWNQHGDFRASMYMRPQAIWAIQHALNRAAHQPNR